jgi:rhodanese-related sulfurtransferase
MLTFLKKLFSSNQAEIEAVLKNGAVILDVRTQNEYRSGSIKGAKNIPLHLIDNQIMKLKKNKKPIVAYCRSGQRSKVAVSKLKANGLEAYNGGSIHRMNTILSK